MKATVIRKMTFEAAHFLPKSVYSGICNRIHGHSYCCHVAIKGDINPETGMVKDFSVIKKAMESCIKKLDHSLLNDYILIPTVENIIIWIWKKLSLFKEMHNISYIELYETENCKCIIKRDDIKPSLLRKWQNNYEIK